MAILEILKFPDARLRKKSLSVETFDDELKGFADSLKETMYSSRGIGLAAPQVNVLKRMMCIDTRPTTGEPSEDRYDLSKLTELEAQVEQPLLMVNPEIVFKEGKTTYDEGCLSVPSYYETVERFEYVEVEYQDIYGTKMNLKTDGLLAICIQHEIDHLDGKLFIDRLSTIKGNRIKSKIKKFGYPSDDEESESSSQ